MSSLLASHWPKNVLGLRAAASEEKGHILCLAEWEALHNSQGQAYVILLLKRNEELEIYHNMENFKHSQK